MDMPNWRETALEMLPELAEDIYEAETPYTAWFSLRLAFEKAYDDSPRDESLIARVYAYSDWCGRAPRGETAADDLLTCVSVCFLEHIPEHPAARADMPRWFTLEELLGSREVFVYTIGESGFAELVEYFQQNPHLQSQRRPRRNPDI